MDEKVVSRGIQQFAARAGAGLTEVSDVLFELEFDGDQYTTLVGIEGVVPGIVVSYSSLCGVLSSASVAPEFLLGNWGGVEGTCFYFSVHVEDDRRPWLYLETRQMVEPDAEAEALASMLGGWRLQWLRAVEATR